MRLTAFLVFVICALLLGTRCPFAADVDKTLRDILTKLERRPQVCADFEQQKHLKVLSRPLLSRGRMVFFRGVGVLWRVTEPFPAAVTLRETNMTRWEKEGRGRVVDYERNPVFGTIAGTLVAIITGDFEKLTTNFDVFANRRGPNGWRIELKPKKDALARMISSVEIEGANFVQEIRIGEAVGDTTRITFADVTFETCQISASEKAFLAE